MTFGGGGGHDSRYQVGILQADINTDNNTTLKDVVSLPVSANTIYLIKIRIQFTSNPTADFKSVVSIPSGATGHRMNGGWNIANTNAPSLITVIYFQSVSDSQRKHLEWWGVLQVGSTAGNIILQMAQTTSNAGPTDCHVGTMLEILHVE